MHFTGKVVCMPGQWGSCDKSYTTEVHYINSGAASSAMMMMMIRGRKSGRRAGSDS